MTLFLNQTLQGGVMQSFSEKMNFVKLTQAQYQSGIFESELFSILLKNNYATLRRNTVQQKPNQEYNGSLFASSSYPFQLQICSADSHSPILLNCEGLVVVKFILYLRMLNRRIGCDDGSNCLLGINMSLLPFGRLCIDVDYKTTDIEESDMEYDKFCKECFLIVADFTTTGSIIMTKNYFTPNTRSFHLITEQQFDAGTRNVLLTKCAERIKARNRNVKIDQVYIWMLPFGRAHVPFQKYNRITNEFILLSFPYNEIDFELTMPFDLSQGTENIYTLYSDIREGAVLDEDTGNFPTLNEYSDDDDKFNKHYYILEKTTVDTKSHLQLFMKVLSCKYNFVYHGLNNMHFEHDFILQVMAHRYNNFFVVMSNKKMRFENNWQIPKTKTKPKPNEYYEIYRFLNHNFMHNIENIGDLFKKMPSRLVQNNVSIGNNSTGTVDNTASLDGQDCRVLKQFTGTINDDFVNDQIEQIDTSSPISIISADDIHPWPYITDISTSLTDNASIHTKSIDNFFRNAIANNVYPYEKLPCNEGMIYFENIQSMLNEQNFVKIVDILCLRLFNKEDVANRTYILSLYEFFCRVHYIDACLNKTDLQTLQACFKFYCPPMREDDMCVYREKYVHMRPCSRVYEPFPIPDTPLAKHWSSLTPLSRVVIHITFMMMVEHNSTSVFVNLLKACTDTRNKEQIVCSFLLNIIDTSKYDRDTETVTKSYACREFLHFVYSTFINAGPKFKCNFEKNNIVFNMQAIDSYLTDLKTMYFTSPLWYFLSNFQYVDEEMDFLTRCDLFMMIFKPHYNAEQFPETIGGPTPPKQAKQSKAGNNATFNPATYFEKHNLPQMYKEDIIKIYYEHILCLINTDNGIYIYDSDHFCLKPFPTNLSQKPIKVDDPKKYCPLYRHQYGIYNTWSMHFERNTNAFYMQVKISYDEFAQSPELFNPFNDNVYRIVINRFLKSITFTRLLNLQKNLSLLLAPIYDPTVENFILPITYKIDSIQINNYDLNSTEFILPESMLTDLLCHDNKLYEMFRWLYCIVCHYSESYACSVANVMSFIPKCILPIKTSNGNSFDPSNDITSLLNKHVNEASDFTGSGSDNNSRGEQLIQNIYKILENKQNEQRENITDELHKLSKREMESLITLFNNVHHENGAQSTADSTNQHHDVLILDIDNITDDLPSTSKGLLNRECGDGDCNNSVKVTDSHAELNKFNLSDGSTNPDINSTIFFGNEEFADTSKIKLLSDLFNRKLSTEISQMSIEEFNVVINDNYDKHITRFILLILSWFLRTHHQHVFSQTLFFRQLTQYSQTIYDQIADLAFKHNGTFILNDRITDVSELFSIYCRNISLTVDPIFEHTMQSNTELYLGYDSEFEERVSPEIIKNIEDGCVAGIYQGQFIEDTVVDLHRMLARISIPRNQHRISPLLYKNSATGKTKFIRDLCNIHFNNKHHINNMDYTALVSNPERGSDVAPQLSANLIVCIEELVELKENFKLLCGDSAITYKRLYSDSKSSFQNNSTVILSTNNDPKCSEEAVLARLHIFPRTIQYAVVNKYLKFQRNTVFCKPTADIMTNNIMSVQFIMNRMPRNIFDNHKGNSMMIWLLKKFFLRDILDPITIQTSETLQQNINTFRVMINVPQLVMEHITVGQGLMKLIEFRKLVNRICEANRTLFSSRVDPYNIYTLMCDNLKIFINDDNDTINVEEKSVV